MAVVENAYDETALVEASLPEDFEPREEELLVLAKRLAGPAAVPEADLLIIDEIGKDISGSGMDTNVVGRKRAFRVQPPDRISRRCGYIFVRGLSDKTHGNAAGIGLADFTTTRLVKAMNYRATRHQLPDGRLPGRGASCRSISTPTAKCSTPPWRSSARGRRKRPG